MPELPRQSDSEPRTELGRIAKGLGLSMHEVPSPPGTAPWERESAIELCPACGWGAATDDGYCLECTPPCPRCGETGCCEDTHDG